MIPSSSSNDDSADQVGTEPVDDLKEGDEAEAEEEAEEAANLGDEVDGGHPEGALELENGRLLGNRLAGIRLLVNWEYRLNDT